MVGLKNCQKICKYERRNVISVMFLNQILPCIRQYSVSAKCVNHVCVYIRKNCQSIFLSTKFILQFCNWEIDHENIFSFSWLEERFREEELKQSQLTCLFQELRVIAATIKSIGFELEINQKWNWDTFWERRVVNGRTKKILSSFWLKSETFHY